MLIKRCKYCGVKFEVIKSMTERTKFCSKSCYTKCQRYHDTHFNGKNNPRWSGGGVKIICPICNREFKVTKVREYIARVCSRRCYSKYRSMKYRGEKNHQWKGSKVTKKCEQCGNNFIGINSRKFCSRKCYGKYRSGNYRGINSQNWKGGIKLPYCAEYINWVQSVRKRDNYRCRICNNNVNINTHHIYPKAIYPELIFDMENGITLCEQCHKYFRNREESFIDFFERIMEV